LNSQLVCWGELPFPNNHVSGTLKVTDYILRFDNGSLLWQSLHTVTFLFLLSLIHKFTQKPTNHPASVSFPTPYFLRCQVTSWPLIDYWKSHLNSVLADFPIDSKLNRGRDCVCLSYLCVAQHWIWHSRCTQ
jgi:hypothetical protein